MLYIPDQYLNTKAERAAKFDAANFPITFVSSVSGVIFSEQPKPGTQLAKLTLIKKSDDQLFQEFVEKGIEKAEYGITSKLEDFKVKTSVYGTNPISAKIGLKEGLEVDYRFFVYEQEQGNDGSIKSVRKALIWEERLDRQKQRQYSTACAHLWIRLEDN